MRVRKDVIIVVVVTDKNKRVWNATSVKTLKICDNVFTLGFGNFKTNLISSS